MLKYYLWKLLGALIGGLIGFFLGTHGQCSTSSGGWALTSNPWSGTLFGAFAGFVLVSPKHYKKMK